MCQTLHFMGACPNNDTIRNSSLKLSICHSLTIDLLYMRFMLKLSWERYTLRVDWWLLLILKPFHTNITHICIKKMLWICITPWNWKQSHDPFASYKKFDCCITPLQSSFVKSNNMANLQAKILQKMRSNLNNNGLKLQMVWYIET